MRDTPAPHPFQAEDDAATPLTNDEKTGLLPSWVTYRHELDEPFARALHKWMLGEVWTWAGEYRTTERNIGVPAWRIAMDLRGLLDDARLWVEQAVYGPDELAVRFHHRLVAIHPFPNGNGRHARLMADLLVTRLGGTAFTWGGGDTVSAGDLRTRYVVALRQADAHELSALVEFARS